MSLSSALREKWSIQITTTVRSLHKAGIIWGDAKAANILIDNKNNAWVIDFGGGFSEGWVEKSQMDTIEGDLATLIKIDELLQSERPRSRGCSKLVFREQTVDHLGVLY